MHKTLGTAAALMLLASYAQAGASGEIAWGDTFAVAKKAASADGKLMLVDFWRDN